MAEGVKTAGTRVLLVRHGSIDWSGCIGAPDDGLSEEGIRQAECVAVRLATHAPGALYSSTMRRALETADIIGHRLGLHVRPDHRLREWHAGDWEGMPEEDLRERYPDIWSRLETDWSFVMPGGETVHDVYGRATEALHSIAAGHPNDTAVIVAHGGSLSNIIAYVLGIDPDTIIARGYHRGREPFVIDNCSLSVIEFRQT